MKECRKCRKTKTNASYSKNSYSKDGLQSYCKVCQKWYNKNKKTSRDKDSSQDIITMKVKRCSQCKEEKPLSDFAKDSYAKTGYRCYCKSCAKYHKSSSINTSSEDDELKILHAQLTTKLREKDAELIELKGENKLIRQANKKLNQTNEDLQYMVSETLEHKSLIKTQRDRALEESSTKSKFSLFWGLIKIG